MSGEENLQLNVFNLLREYASPSDSDCILELSDGNSFIPNNSLQIGSTCFVHRIAPNIPPLMSSKETIPPNNIKWIIANTTQLPYRMHTFDTLIGTQFTHRLPKQLALLQEVHRVLKPKGKLVFTVYGELELSPLHHAFIEALSQAGIDTSKIRELYDFYDPVSLGDLVANAGFKDVSVIRKTLKSRFLSVQDFVQSICNSNLTIRVAFLKLPKIKARQIISEISNDIGKNICGDAVQILTTFNLVFGRRL